jgi:type IV secretory pathway TraG/TraD family ATPase VirD4
MTPTKLLIGQILIVRAIVLAGIWLATQWAAADLAYQSELGAPWAMIGGISIYRPWSIFLWWYHFDAYAPHVFDQAGAIAGTSGLVGCGAAVAGSLWRARQRGNVTTYGSARWASTRAAAAPGLFRDAGVFLGRLNARYLRHDGPEHVMAFAPTRSGKGVGLVVPTLLGWSGSAVIHDIKGENWQLTAGWRTRFSHCLLFNPTDARSARYNPLLEVRRGADEVRDVQNIADILVDPVITTDRRVYHLALTSGERAAMVALSWTYPQDQLIAMNAAAEQARAVQPVANGLQIEQLRFNYAISGDQPSWRPLRAFDDGRQTFIEFPASVATGEAPPLFLVDAQGNASLVNYRLQGRFYVVDRLFVAAELRLGLKHQDIVRISRVDEADMRRRAS